MNPFDWLLNITSGYGSVLVFFLLYWVVKKGCGKLAGVEKAKRKRIIQQIDEIKARYRKSHQEKQAFDATSSPHQQTMWAVKQLYYQNRFVDTFRMQEQESPDVIEAIRKDSEQVMRAEKARPFWFLVMLFFPFVVFVLALAACYGITEIPKYAWLPFVLAIVSFLRMVTKEKWLFSFVLSLLLYWLFTHMSGAAGFFLLFYFSALLIEKRVWPKITGKKSQKNEDVKEG